MSDEEFLARWSRRKREAKAAVDAPPPTEPAETPDPAPSATAENPANAEVDLANLPPVESITAATDVTAFLRHGIPPELSRAALRRSRGERMGLQRPARHARLRTARLFGGTAWCAP